ncbi:hypothetical protein MLD38_001748 [Melastoma candidum]|uniref:Uncharacterized protein n=1 Tax=Melastoma candidum TaxID=119954 RepID=A0ACB9SE54_9MYRT|nr:hypothetical protein MLD38_001748 [Melastoma candidum]
MALSTSLHSPVKIVSDWFVRPHRIPPGYDQPIHLPPWDMAMLNIHYIQKGLLFAKPTEVADPESFMSSLLDNLRHSLSLTLVHFYPLAGRLATLQRMDDGDKPFYTIYISCKDSPGARLVYATLDMTVSDILSPTYVPVVVQSFFDHDKAVGHDGHSQSLLTVQVTELEDGVFVGCSMNHCVVDGTSFWHFFNSFSEIFRAFTGGKTDFEVISRPPVLERWFAGNRKGPMNLSFRDAGEFLDRFEAPVLQERIFHFSAESIAALKARANRESETSKISSFQSLSALVWRSVTRARKFPAHQVTGCRLAANNRHRLDPPLSPDYFGNSITPVRTSATVGDLLGNDLGWAAWKLHLSVANHTSEVLMAWNENWFKTPAIYKMLETFDPSSVMLGSSPRFNKYGNEFGMGKALALRSGYANKFDGKVTGYPGREGVGSIDLEICLPVSTMAAIENDPEFMGAVTV